MLSETIPWTASTSLTPASGGSSRWRSDMVKPAKNTICLWYDRDAQDAAEFYAAIFPDSSVGAVNRAPGDFPSGKKGGRVDRRVYGDGRSVPRAQRRTCIQA